MRLISAHIENFGKIHDYDVNFDSNPYIILEDNGWGKTTLAAFIKVMFFGFDGDRKQSITENERKMYMPWNKGTFGGSIIFEVNKKEYVLSRVFGSKVQDDTAQLKDNITKLESDDFELDSIGEQIFEIDAASFRRTIFISKNDMMKDSEELGGSIQAKIGNLTDATDDVNNYDNVMKNLKERLSKLKRGNKNGVINELNSRAQEINAELLRTASTDDILEEVGKKYASEQKRMEEIRAELKSLDKLMNESSLAGEYEAKKKRYLDAMAEAEELREKIAGSKSYFKYEIPDEKELDDMIATARGLERLSADMDNNKTGPGEEASCKLPTMEVLDSIIDSWKKYKDYMSNINACEVRLENARANAEIQKRLIEENSKRRYEEEKRTVEQQYAMKSNAVGKNFVIMLSAGILLLIVSVLLYSVMGIGGIIAGGGMIVGAFIYRSSSLSKIKKNLEHALSEVKQSNEQFSENVEVERYTQEKRQLEEASSKIHGSTRDFFVEYDMNFYEEGVERELYNLRDKVKNFDFTREKTQKYEKAKAEYEENRKKCEEYLLKISGNIKQDIAAGLQEIKQALAMYNNDNKSLREKVRFCENYWVNEPYDMEHAPASTEISTDEIIQKKERLNDEAEICNDAINSYKTQIDDLTQKKDVRDEAEAELADVETRLKHSKAEYDIIELVSGHLKKAKEQLTATYMEPISDAFVKYYGFIYEDDLDSYEIDANINITKIEEGANRSVESLSAGYRDLVLVALRMALVDSMYTDEKPFVIMDDPFVNLDTKKVKAAKQFLNEVSKDYQVLYFTCHESRT